MNKSEKFEQYFSTQEKLEKEPADVPANLESLCDGKMPWSSSLAAMLTHSLVIKALSLWKAKYSP